MSGRQTGLPAEIPAFNWGAFFLPPIWGVAHGQWPGIFFLPLWVFVDNMLRGPRPFGDWTLVLGWSMAAVTVAFQAAYAWNANRFAWHRAEERTSPRAFARAQRVWGLAGALVFVAMCGWIIAFLSRTGTGA